MSVITRYTVRRISAFYYFTYVGPLKLRTRNLCAATSKRFRTCYLNFEDRSWNRNRGTGWRRDKRSVCRFVRSYLLRAEVGSSDCQCAAFLPSSSPPLIMMTAIFIAIFSWFDGSMDHLKISCLSSFLCSHRAQCFLCRLVASSSISRLSSTDLASSSLCDLQESQPAVSREHNNNLLLVLTDSDKLRALALAVLRQLLASSIPNVSDLTI